MSRSLILVPIIHTPADLGSMSAAIRALHLRQQGKEQWNRRLQTVENLWQVIRQEIDDLGLDYRHVLLYQDGLPNADHAADIVRDLARAGSLNHMLLVDLLAKGARLVGTESPELLLEEYALAQQVLTALGSGQVSARRQQELKKLSQRLLERRDCYIAERIDRTLQAGETGLIFLGMLHVLEGRLPGDIRLFCLGQDQDGSLAPKGERQK